jgi:hypothetical protein
MYFPTICVDNFFNDPEEVRKFALSLDYAPQPQGVWPGKRTECLSEISPYFYKIFFQKFFSLSYSKTENLDGRMNLFFALMPPETVNHIDTGWIHRDSAHYAGLVYLNKNIPLNCGTSIFRKKNYFYDDDKTGDIKSRLYLGSTSDEDIDGLKNHNSNYEETIKFGNIYNRLIAFDAKQFHGIDTFSKDENEPRLTILFFIYDLQASRFPIPESKTYKI